jgi:hypothetical protein
LDGATTKEAARNAERIKISQKMKKVILMVFITSMIFLVSCGSSRKSAWEASNAAKVPIDFQVFMERTPCFGTCPVYKIEVNAAGTLIWTGIRFTEREHIWSRQLNDEERSMLWQEVQRTGYFDMAAEYDDPAISDAPWVLLEIEGKGKTHKVKDRIGAPAALRQLQSMLDTLANQPGLIFVKDLEIE